MAIMPNGILLIALDPLVSVNAIQSTPTTRKTLPEAV